MNTNHLKTFLVDGDQGILLNLNSANPLKGKTMFYYGDTCTLNFTVQHSDGTPFNLAAYTFLFGINNNFNSANPDLIRVANAYFTPLSLSGGTFTVLVDFKKTTLLNALGAKQSITGIACLWALGTNNLLLAQFNCILNNLVYKP